MECRVGLRTSSADRDAVRPASPGLAAGPWDRAAHGYGAGRSRSEPGCRAATGGGTREPTDFETMDIRQVRSSPEEALAAGAMTPLNRKAAPALARQAARSTHHPAGPAATATRQTGFPSRAPVALRSTSRGPPR